MSQSKLNQRTREIFIEKKLREITIFIGIIVAIIFIPYVMGNTTYAFFPEWVCSLAESCPPPVWEYWIIGILALLFSLLVVFFLFIIIRELVKWIENNWIESKKQALQELRK